ncbi:hypothetical protein O7632_07310 [Solwaraspora sp. WMMD406]|uniref:hypothetical protein n=1 Tax=Solwaraspora sp. WMMD406 TaxID=3016095 RepID=UPI0024180CD2|nr:hypothetical protein [Solwaraspora sp. WMMD406]MDG4763917.1 hypothetical protein [Solwaraspora sp. WMMD406]
MDTDPRFRLTAVREDVRAHLPTRWRICRTCGRATPCRPFLRALTILDRHDPAKARRLRTVLHLSGLWSAPLPARK